MVRLFSYDRELFVCVFVCVFFGLADPMYVFPFCNHLGEILLQNVHAKT